MDLRFISSDETEEFLTEERCHILELLNHNDDRTQSVARARVEPGITTAWHRLIDTTESIYVLEGMGTLEIDEENFFQVQKGDVVKIPANTPQRISNTGDEDLLFLCFCIPAFSDESYEALE